MAVTEQINPKLLSWGRKSAGLSLEEAAAKLALKDSTRATAVEKLQSFESGERSPTYPQLLKFAAVYRRPLISFYLETRPERGDLGEDFRTSRGEATARDDALLDAIVRDVRARQLMLRSVLEDEDEAYPLDFVGSVHLDDGPEHVALLIRNAMGVTAEDQKRAKNPAAWFTSLRNASERIGVYVLLLGDAGSYHSDVGPDVFRGFALSDPAAPIVVINDNDATTARSFTLIHELAHIWIGASGVSGPLRDIENSRIEKFCNDVAGEFLLPPSQIPDMSRLLEADVATVQVETRRLAEIWNVSETLIVYRLARNGWIARDVAASLFRMFAARWSGDRQRAKESRDSDESGPNYYVVRRHRLGSGLLGVVSRALQGDVITHTKAAMILGVRPLSVAPLLVTHGGRS